MLLIKKKRNQESILLNLEPTFLEKDKTTKEVLIYEKITHPENTKISINYYNDLWNRNEINIDNIFAFSIAQEIMYDDYEPQSITNIVKGMIGLNERRQSRQN